jgi:hypothetical protein
MEEATIPFPITRGPGRLTYRRTHGACQLHSLLNLSPLSRNKSSFGHSHNGGEHSHPRRVYLSTHRQLVAPYGVEVASCGLSKEGENSCVLALESHSNLNLTCISAGSRSLWGPMSQLMVLPTQGLSLRGLLSSLSVSKIGTIFDTPMQRSAPPPNLLIA